MKLKVDENGYAVVQDGKPVYVHDDGQEVPFDAEAAMSKISTLNSESKDHRIKAKEAGEKLALFEGIDPDNARKALETVKNLDDKKLIDAGQVDTLKAEMNKAFVEKENNLKKAHQDAVGQLHENLKAKDSTIYNLMVTTKFATSPTIMDKTTIPQDIAADYFGKHFRVEGEGESAQVIGHMNGEKIFSRERPGEPAGFEEALNVIIDAYPMKERILKSSSGGSGSGGNRGNDTGDSKTIKRGDSKAFGDNLEKIAKGEVTVV